MKKIRTITTVVVTSETPFTEEFYPGMTLGQAVRYELALPDGERADLVIQQINDGPDARMITAVDVIDEDNLTARPDAEAAATAHTAGNEDTQHSESDVRGPHPIRNTPDSTPNDAPAPAPTPTEPTPPLHDAPSAKAGEFVGRATIFDGAHEDSHAFEA